jgi:hypothetical protein
MRYTIPKQDLSAIFDGLTHPILVSPHKQGSPLNSSQTKASPTLGAAVSIHRHQAGRIADNNRCHWGPFVVAVE